MVLGTGIDIIEIERIQQSVEKLGDQFLNKIYTPLELNYCLKKINKYQHLAARFAAKEAIYKALNSIVNFDFGWHDVEIFNEPNGLPIVRLGEKFSPFLSEGKEIKISMSHSRDYVACVAIAYSTK